MHKRASWIVVGFVAVVVIAAALDAVFFRSHAPASARGMTSEATPGTTSKATTTSERFSDAPVCRSNQLVLRLNRRSRGYPLRLHDDYVTLLARRGVCRFSGRLRSLAIFADGRLVEGGVIQDQGADFAGAYGSDRGHIYLFRFSPPCRQSGPFVAQVEVGEYVATGKIHVYRCGIEPPSF
jgi:hypothetical protein